VLVQISEPLWAIMAAGMSGCSRAGTVAGELSQSNVIHYWNGVSSPATPTFWDDLFWFL
jgi:hypothetical protein